MSSPKSFLSKVQPLYGGKGEASIEVSEIEGRAGWLVRHALIDRFAAGGGKQAPQYRLDVRLDDLMRRPSDFLQALFDDGPLLLNPMGNLVDLQCELISHRLEPIDKLNVSVI